MIISAIKYADGTVGITYRDCSIVVDSVHLIDRTEAEIADFLKWQFLGYGIGFEDEQLERLASTVIGVL